MFEVNTSLLRFWEKEFTQLQPRKNQRGKRMYTPKDIEMFKVVYHLVKERGFTIDGARRKLRENKDETINESVISEKLNLIKEELLKIKNNL